MTPEVARAREELELARATAARLWAEISADARNRKRSPVATPEEVRRLREASSGRGAFMLPNMLSSMRSTARLELLGRGAITSG